MVVEEEWANPVYDRGRKGKEGWRVGVGLDAGSRHPILNLGG